MLDAMSDFIIRLLEPADADWVRQFMIDYWGAAAVVTRGRIHYPHTHSGFVAHAEGVVAGLLTYCLAEGECEITALNSLREGRRFLCLASMASLCGMKLSWNTLTYERSRHHCPHLHARHR